MKLIIVPIVAILAILAIELYALSLGIKGTVLAGTLVIIAGLGGYEAKALKEYMTRKK